MLVSVSGIVPAGAQSALKVRLTDNSPLNVAVDGRYFNKRGTSVTVGDLPPGKHFVQVYNFMRGYNGRGREHIIFEGKVRTTEGMMTLLEYDPYNRQSDIHDMEMPAVNMNPEQGQYRNNDNNNDRRYEDNGYSYPRRRNSNDAQPASPVSSVTETRIDQLKTTVNAKKTDTEKTNLLKSELQNEQLTTSQVGMMMDWLSFESAKVEFAEWAYNLTLDKENFADLESKLTYKNFQDDLDKFLKSKQ